MFRIDESRVTAWIIFHSTTTTVRYPEVVGVACPGCHLKHAFYLSPTENNPARSLGEGLPFGASCPSCKATARFYVLNASNSEESWGGEIWMSPAPRVRDPLPIHTIASLPTRLARDYLSTLDCYASGHWRAAAQQARTILEGTVKSLLSEGSGLDRNGRPLGLAALFNVLADERDLAKPIKDIGEVLREGGNLASHFDADRDIDRELASEVLELLDAFLEYLLLIPDQVTSLRSRIAGPPAPQAN